MSSSLWLVPWAWRAQHKLFWGKMKEVPLLLQFISFHLNLSFILKCRSEEAAPLGPFGLFCAELWLCQYISLAPLWGVAEQRELLLEQRLRRVGQSLPSLKTALGKEKYGLTRPWPSSERGQGVGERFGQHWQLDSPWTPGPYQCPSADWSDSQLATFKKWSLRLYFPHSQILSSRPVTCNTCCSAVTAWVWISGVPVLYATSIILCFHKKRFSQFLSWMTFCVNNECEMHLTCTHIEKFLQKNIWVIKDALQEVGAPHKVSAAVGTLPAERMSLKIYLKLTKRIIKQRRILKNALSSWETTSFSIMSEQILGPWREANWNKMAPPLTCIMMDWERVLTL